MLRHPPRLSYSGLTIILSNPSRFDRLELLSATAGWFFNNECLYPETNRYCCDIRLADDKSPLLKNTKCVLLLGQRALTLFTGKQDYFLEEMRGSILEVNGIPCVATYLPQNAVDMKNYEKTLNPAATVDIEVDEEKKEFIAAKGKSRTAISSYRFWIRQDTKKALRILSYGKPTSPYTPIYHIYPNSAEVINLLTTIKNSDFYFDMETDFTSVDMRCFSFTFTPKDKEAHVYVVPTLDTNYRPAYAELSFIIRALAGAIRDNCIVAHNGTEFDFLVLAYKYGIPIGNKCYDTLVANHRIYPEIEKSLAHCVSLWTCEPFHKNGGEHGYMNEAQADKLYRYCGKDVFTMLLVKEAQLAFAKTIPGLSSSIEQAMSSIKPYLTATIMGMRYDETMRAAWCQENDRLMMQYLRIMDILTGKEVDPLVSSQKCCRYFHDKLNYPVVKRSQKTNAPSLDEGSLLKLKLQHKNPVIDFLIAYRKRQKETGVLNFEPWRK